MSILSVENLCFAYATSNTVIRDLTMSVEIGEIVSILGASGCGKTTLLNLISGVLSAEKGKINVVSSSSGSIGYIFQQDALLPWRTVKKNILLANELRAPKSPSRTGTSVNEHIAAYLSAFHLDETILDLFPAQLSGGMRQRISIIQSLMFNPELLLLDEPFSALDFYTKLRLESEFRELIKRQNKAAILVTHDIDEAIAMSDRVLIMERGSLTREHKILLPQDRNPEEARGTPQFSQHYQQIWSELKTAIAV
jgi:NitT/TauT family transport system ATP-binding protein